MNFHHTSCCLDLGFVSVLIDAIIAAPALKAVHAEDPEVQVPSVLPEDPKVEAPTPSSFWFSESGPLGSGEEGRGVSDAHTVVTRAWAGPPGVTWSLGMRNVPQE